MPKKRPTKQRKRYPRFIEGNSAAAQSKLVWSEPEFNVHVDEHGIELKFRLSISGKLVAAYASDLTGLFAINPRSWETAIKRAYNEGVWNRKPIPQLIASHLRIVRRNAVLNWLGETWNLVNNDPKRDAEIKGLRDAQLERLRKGDSQTRGPQPDAQVALRAAIRFRKLLPAVKNARAELKKKAPYMDEGALTAEIGSRFPIESFRYALNKACGNDPEKSASVPLAQFFLRGVNPRTIAQHLVGKILSISEPILKKVSVATHIERGEELLAALAPRS
jgi:hypothetical protein